MKKIKKPLYGERKLIKGEQTFYLSPYEQLEGVYEVRVLTADKALLVKALQNFQETESGKRRIAGEKWLIYGPKEYWPPLEVDVIATKDAFFKLEGLNLYLFKFDAFLLALIAVFISLFLFVYFIRSF